MRWTSCTPGIISTSRVSKSWGTPTPPGTVMCALVFGGRPSLLQFSVLEPGIGLDSIRRWWGFRHNLVFLDAAHHVHNSLVNLRQIAFAQRTGIAALDIGNHLALALWFVNRQVGMAFQSSNFDGSRGTLVEQRRQFAVQFVDFLAPIGNVHS